MLLPFACGLVMRDYKPVLAVETLQLVLRAAELVQGMLARTANPAL